jgi:hypothetical protein
LPWVQIVILASYLPSRTEGAEAQDEAMLNTPESGLQAEHDGSAGADHPLISMPPVGTERAKPARLPLDHITLDGRLQSRPLKACVVKAYFEALRRGEELPAVLVVYDATVVDKYYLVDGHHRYAATSQLSGIEYIGVKIVDGTFADAQWLSWGANRSHGLRCSQQDKRRAIQAAVEHPRWKQESDRAIAQHIGCDHKTVGVMRRNRGGGEFPTLDKAAPGRCPSLKPSKRKILQACRLLSKVRPEHARRQFNNSELATVRAGYEPLHRLLFGARTLGPKKPRVEARSKCETNANNKQD